MPGTTSSSAGMTNSDPWFGFQSRQSGQQQLICRAIDKSFAFYVSTGDVHWRNARRCKRIHRAVSIGERRVRGNARTLTADAGKEFFTNNLALLHSVNADFGHFPALFRFLVRNIGVVLHNKTIVRDKGSLLIEAVQ